MADAEESPSSLADLEALAGLTEESSQASDDFANEADAGNFDLASLATSAGVGARDAGAVVSDDDRHTDQDDRLHAPAPTANPSATADTARGRWGFVLGVIAGVAAAGVLFMVLRETSAPRGLSPVAVVPTSAATKHVDLSTSAAPSAAAGNSVQRPAPIATSPVPDAPKVARPATARPVVSAAATPSPDVEAPADDDPNADPTRPPSAPSRAERPEPAAPSRPIDSLLDDALGSGKPAKRANPDGLMGAELPLTPTAGDVTKVIQVLLPAIRGCAMGQSGTANTLLVVRNDGGVASAAVTGAPYAGAASGRCMEGVLRRAKFARFQQSVFRVQFPLSIRANAP